MPLHKHRTACCLRYMTKSNLIACWGPNSHRITTLWDWTSNPTGQGNKQFQPHFLMVKCIEALKKTCRFGEDRHHFNSTIDKLLAIVLPCHPGTFNATSLMSFLRHVVPFWKGSMIHRHPPLPLVCHGTWDPLSTFWAWLAIYCHCNVTPWHLWRTICSKTFIGAWGLL